MISRFAPILLLALLGGCGSDDSQPFTEAVEESLLALTSLEITGTETLLDADTTRQLNVTATDAENQPLDFTTQVHWSSDNSSIASVSGGGLVSALSPGIAIISARYGSLSDSIMITVSNAELLSLTLSAAEISVNECQNIQLSAIGSYDDGSQRNVTELVSWSSANGALAAFDSRNGQEGLLRTFAGGITSTSASYKGQTGQLDVTINDSLLSLTMLPGSPTLEVGTTQALTATGRYGDGTQADISDNAQWTFINSGSGTAIGSIDNIFPDKGTFTANSVGSVLVQAACGGAQTNNSVTVTTTNALDHIEISSGQNPIQITDGDSLSLTLTAVYTVSVDADVTESATWSVISGDASMISVSNSSGTKGDISYTGTGSVIVKATYNDQQAFTEVRVAAR